MRRWYRSLQTPAGLVIEFMQCLSRNQNCVISMSPFMPPTHSLPAHVCGTLEITSIVYSDYSTTNQSMTRYQLLTILARKRLGYWNLKTSCYTKALDYHACIGRPLKCRIYWEWRSQNRFSTFYTLGLVIDKARYSYCSLEAVLESNRQTSTWQKTVFELFIVSDPMHLSSFLDNRALRNMIIITTLDWVHRF